MEELKTKYGITDEAIQEIADAVEPEEEVPPEPRLPTMGKTGRVYQPSLISQAMKGDISIAEAIILLDYQDRRERREEERRWAREGGGRYGGQTSDLEKILNEMREERKEHQDQIEKLILNRRAEDAEEKAKRAEAEKEELVKTQKQKEIMEVATRTAAAEALKQYEPQITMLAEKVSTLNPQQRQGFFDEVFAGVETDLKNQFTQSIIERLKPPVQPITKTDEQGKTSVDWNALIDRGAKLAERYIDAQKGPPPKLEMKEISTTPGGIPSPLAEGSQEKTPPEAPTKVETPVTSPISPLDIKGIGPERAKRLEEMNITDARQLAIISPSHLKESLNISKETAEDIIKQAKDLVETA